MCWCVQVQQQRDEAMKEINQAMAVRIKASKDLSRLTEERNAAVQEYTLIMSERDSVHKEIERLQEELQEAQNKARQTEASHKASLDEVGTLFHSASLPAPERVVGAAFAFNVWTHNYTPLLKFCILKAGSYICVRL